MTEKRNRWIVSIIMGLAFLAFVGISFAPFLGTLFQGTPSTATNSPAPTASTSPSAQKAELEAQAKGYELVLQREPDNITALRGLLEAKLALGDVQGAVNPLEKLAKLQPDETLYSVLLAQARQQLGDAEGAAQAYRSVLTNRRGDMQALNGLTGLLLQQNRPEAAIGLLQDTLKAAPQANQVQPNSIDVASVQILLGSVYAGQKRYDEAIAVYDEVSKANAQDFRPIFGKAVALKEQGKVEEAKPLFTKAAELAPAQYKDQINQLASNASPAPSGGKTEVAPGANAPVPKLEPAPELAPTPGKE